MTEDQVLPLLRALSADRQALTNGMRRLLWKEGWIQVEKTDYMQEDERQYMFTFFTEKAKRL